MQAGTSAAAGRSNFQPSRSSTPAPQAELTRAEKAHFSTISGGFGAKFLAKQGWAPGKGLGLNEDGRAVPVAVGTMMRGEGIRSGIRTEDSKREARRKGELVEEEEPKQKKGQRKGGQRAAPSREGWTKHKKVKVKVEHKTYEQLLAEEGPDTTRPGVGLVIDARGGDLKTVESIADLSLSGWTPSTDATQLPELRHNLRLVVDVTRGEVNSLVKEGKAVNERRRWTMRDEERSRHKADESTKGNCNAQTALTTTELQSLEVVKASVDEISAISQRQVSEGSSSLHSLEDAFNRLLITHDKEYRLLGLDDVVVGAIDMVLRKPFAQWQPFEVSADALLSTLKPWKKAFNLDGAPVGADDEATDRSMTAWESLLWQRWLPKVRSAINNDWDVLDPQPAVHLIESWDPILPLFIHDNILDQLVLPKVTVAVEEWTGRPLRDGRNVSLASIIFPWLPLMGERVGDLLESGKRRVRAVLRKWKPEDGVLSELQRWRDDIFSTHEWDKLMGDYVLGKLGDVLRDGFVVNPRNQDMKPLKDIVLPWHTLIRTSNFVRLFELEFFPKWLNVLHMWLAHPGYNADEVAQWFEMWKGTFPADIAQHRGMAHGFNTGLKLMRDAVELGSAAPSKLQKPQYAPLRSGSKPANGAPQPSGPVSKPVGQRMPAPEDITFRSIAEEVIAENDLLMRPLGKSHSITGKPLFRIGKTIEGKGGLVVYFGDDAVFAQAEDGVFRATSLEDVVKRAS
jgi:tuftelin-interacting protein 11